MKNYTYVFICLLIFSININPQKNNWIEDEIIISFQDSIIDSNTGKTTFSFANIRDEKIIKSEQLKFYLLKNEVEEIEFHPFIKELKSQNKFGNYKGRTLKNINEITAAKIKFKEKKNIDDVIKELKAIKGVYNASPNYIQNMDVVPNDYHLNYHPGSYYGNNWGFHNWNIPQNDINMETAWNIQTGSTNIKVAVIDNGIDYNNPDLGSYYGPNYKVAGGWNFISSGLPPLPDPSEEKAL